ncbi:MAG: sulfotransferase [Hyphomicrobiaceae bacterium]|nr:sulfotransferase [Hyphomicrobiaceae bacterium]
MASKQPDRRVRFWHARFWHGMTLSVWIRLLVYGRFAVAPVKWGHVVTITITAFFNSAAGLAQRMLKGREIDAVTLPADPIFVIGHWRSGTTLLHELMILDDRVIFPDTFQCMSPHHFLLTSGYTKMVRFLVPSNRPMDDMQAGWHLPQEDEFALMNLGLPSPYLQVAFPDAPRRKGTLSLSGLSTGERERWRAGLSWFLKAVTLQSGPKQMIVKSPTHTARVRTLIDLYPKARFVLITRDPSAVMGSTHKLWVRLCDTQGLQLSDHRQLDARIADEYEEMMEALIADLALVPEGQFHHVHYQDLTADPVGRMEKVYRALGRDGFDAVTPKISAYFAEREDFRVDAYQLTDEQAGLVERRIAPLTTRLMAAIAARGASA